MARANWILVVTLMACNGGNKDPDDGGPTDVPNDTEETTPEADNVAPDAAGDLAGVDEGGTVVVNVTVNDVDDDGIDLGTVTIVDAPEHGTATAGADGLVEYVHDGAEDSVDAFTYTVSDVNGAVSNVAEVEIEVLPVDDPLVALDDAAVVDEGESVLIDVVANDSDPDDEIELTTIRIGAQPQHGIASPQGDGTISYLHDGSEAPTDSFTYGVRNTGGDGDTSVTVTITVNPVNDAPTANNDAAAAVDGALTHIVVAANDVDPDDGLDLSTVVLVTQPSHGTVTVVGDGSIDYQHDGLGELNDSFRYTIADAGGVVSNAATVQLADSACATHPQWMPVTCTTPDWVWSRDRNQAVDVPTAASLGLLATGCFHSGLNQPEMGEGMCSLDGLGWVSVDQFPMVNCDTEWYHLGGNFTGDCGGHNVPPYGDVYRHLVIDPLGCYSY